MSQSINSRNALRQSQELRAPFGQCNFEINDCKGEIKLKKKQSKIDPTVAIKVKNVR